MELATTAAAMTAGLFFSCCLAFLAEELVFGAIVRWFFRPAEARARRTASALAGQYEFLATSHRQRKTKQG